MNKESFEKLNDGFINLYEYWIFMRCYERSAILLAQITWYKLYPNIDKKTWFIFLELSFPKSISQQIKNELERRWYFLRIVDKEGKIYEIYGDKRLQWDVDSLRNIKTSLVKYT